MNPSACLVLEVLGCTPFERELKMFTQARGENLRPLEQAGTKIPLVELWKDDLAQHTPGVGIVERLFQAIADLDAGVVVLNRSQDQESIVLALFPDPPGLKEPDRVALDVFPLQRWDRDDGHLDATDLLELREELGEGLFRFRIDYVRKIIDPSLGLRQILGGKGSHRY